MTAPRVPLDPAALADRVASGDRRALAKAITLVESGRADDRVASVEALERLLGRTGSAVRVGVSGPPGVGKSTLIESLGLRLVASGRTVAVLAVDPSSSRTGGSVLGDKTRMGELARHPNAYIRPSPSRGDLGGIARRTSEAVLLCEAAGFDVVVVETVGVGQSEVAVADVVDTFVLLLTGGGGDDLQGMKRGIMELADVIAVTKADGDLLAAATRTVADYRRAVALLPRRWRGWEPEVLAVSAVTGEHLDELWDAVSRHRAHLEATGALASLRRDQSVAHFHADVVGELLDRLRRDHADRFRALEADVAAGRRLPAAAAADLLETSLRDDAAPDLPG